MILHETIYFSKFSYVLIFSIRLFEKLMYLHEFMVRITIVQSTTKLSGKLQEQFRNNGVTNEKIGIERYN